MTDLAALHAFEHEVSRLFPADSAQARAVAHPLGQLRALLAPPGELVPELAPEVAALLDAIEDILESLLSQAGWPGATIGSPTVERC